MKNILKILKFATLYSEASLAPATHQWAAGVVDQAFQQVMGRRPTQAERQIVMAVSNLESGYGTGWGKGKSRAGEGSHNWGAVQTSSKTEPSFAHEDSSSQGKYQTRFKAYPDDISGAADVVRLLFKGSRKQQMPNPEQGFRTTGGPIEGPTRGELIELAAQQGDTLAFSKAMWYTTYFEGFNEDFTKNIKIHADGIQRRINSIASALGESPAWSIKSDNYLPVTNDRSVIQRIIQMKPEAAGSGRSMVHTPAQQSPVANTPYQMQTPESFPAQQPDLGGLENMLWFN